MENWKKEFLAEHRGGGGCTVCCENQTSKRVCDSCGLLVFIPASNEPSGCLQTFGDCREGQKPRPLGRFKFDAPLLAAGFLTLTCKKCCNPTALFLLER